MGPRPEANKLAVLAGGFIERAKRTRMKLEWRRKVGKGKIFAQKNGLEESTFGAKDCGSDLTTCIRLN